MSKIILSTISTLIISIIFIAPAPLYAAQDSDDQQLSVQERAEQHRKRKPKIAQRQTIRAALKAMRKNGALKRASRRRSANRAERRNNRIAARAAQAVTNDTTDTSEEVVAIKHVLTCETEALCQTAVEWGNSNNYNTTDVLTSEGHGGEVMYHLFLRQEVTPDEDSLTSESSKVHEAVETLPGIRYATWMVDLDPTGEQD